MKSSERDASSGLEERAEIFVSLQRHKVLIFDDERVIDDTLANTFIEAGCSAKAVYSAEQALELLRGPLDS